MALDGRVRLAVLAARRGAGHVRDQPLETQVDLAVRGEDRAVEPDHGLGDGRHPLHREQAVGDESQRPREVAERRGQVGVGAVVGRDGFHARHGRDDRLAASVDASLSADSSFRQAERALVPRQQERRRRQTPSTSRFPQARETQTIMQLVGGPLRLAEHVVAVVDLALDHLDLAAAADPLLAVVQHVDARPRAAPRGPSAPAAPARSGRTRRGPPRRRARRRGVARDDRRREPLEVQRPAGQPRHPLLDRGEQRLRAARVDERVRPRRPEQPGPGRAGRGCPAARA